MLVAKSTLAHIGQLNRALGASIHEPVATLWAELGRGDNLSQLLHVRWLDINNVEALILDIQVPEVYPQIVTGNEGLSIAVYRNAVNVVGVRIGICSARHGGHYSIVVCKTWKLQIVCAVEMDVVLSADSSSTTCSCAWGQIMREVVLRHNLQRLLENLP